MDHGLSLLAVAIKICCMVLMGNNLKRMPGNQSTFEGRLCQVKLTKRGEQPMTVSYRSIAMFLLATNAALAQVDGVTVTVTQNVAAPPSQANFLVNASADPSLSLEQVVQRLQGIGITGTNFVGLQSGGQFGSRIGYQFQFSGGIAKIKDTLDALDRIHRSATDLDLQYFVIGTGFDDAATQEVRQKLTPDLLAEARRRVESLAAAVSASVGHVLAISAVFSAPPAEAAASPVFTLTARFSLE